MEDAIKIDKIRAEDLINAVQYKAFEFSEEDKKQLLAAVLLPHEGYPLTASDLDRMQDVLNQFTYEN